MVSSSQALVLCGVWFVYVYVCMCTCVFINVDVYVDYMYVYAYVHVFAYVHINVYVYEFVYVDQTYVAGSFRILSLAMRQLSWDWLLWCEPVSR